VDTWIAFVYLVLFVTVVAFMLYMFVLGKWTASGTSYGFVLIPLVTIVVATTVADESITPGFLVGAALVLAGVYVGALMPAQEKQEALWECQDEAGEVLPRCM
jgi:drug/metabolite transporter (DMT)-like permease